MTNLDRLNEVAAHLPESTIGELVDFAQFLKSKLDANVASVLSWHDAVGDEEEAPSHEELEALSAAREETDAISWESAKTQLGL